MAQGFGRGAGADGDGLGAALLLLLPLDLLPARHVAVVLVDVVREAVPALAVGDEIKRAIARRGRDRRQDRGAARIADRPGRQAGHDVGVVGRARLQVGTRQLAALHALAVGHAVDRGRIALQPHPDPQPIDVDRRHPRPLGRYGGFLLDDRAQDQRVALAGIGQTGGALAPRLVERLLHRLLHAQQHAVARVAARIEICFRQQVAFLHVDGDVARQRVGLAHQIDDLGRRGSLGNREPALHQLAGLQQLDQRPPSRCAPASRTRRP